MASPLTSSRKATVDLAAKAAPGSRIRRDPPPVVRKTVVPDREIVDRKAVTIGILAVALTLLVVIFAFSSWAGWSPRQYTINVRLR